MVQLDAGTEAAVRQFLAEIGGRYDLVEAIVYGSRARGTHRPDSDVDLAVLLRGQPQRMVPVKLDMADTAFDVMLDTGLLISPLPVWHSEWEHPDRYSNPALLRNIAREGVRISLEAPPATQMKVDRLLAGPVPGPGLPVVRLTD